MSQPSGNHPLPRWALLGGGGFALLLAGFVLFGPSGEKASAGEPMFNGAAVQNKDTLVVSLAVTNPDDGKLIGTLRAELVDASDRVVASREQSIAQSAKTAVYRFELIDVKKPSDQLTLRYILGKTKVEVPLKKQLLIKGHETALTAGTELHAGTTTAHLMVPGE